MKNIIYISILLAFANCTIAKKEKEPKDEIIEVRLTDETKADQVSPIFTVVENQPQFPGGEEALNKFLAENINYPKKAKKKEIEGTVYIQFVIETDGSISDEKILRGIGDGCDEETMRVVKLMPNWKPGTQRGKPVRVRFVLPVRFKLTE